MIEGLRVAVVMPMYNEAMHVAATLRNVPALVDDIVVVDDGSSDGSSNVVRSVHDPRVLLVPHEKRRGVGCALATGLTAAIGLGPDLLVTMDSDGQMSPADLPRLLSPLAQRNATYVKGNRFAPGISRSVMPLHRRFVNRLSSAYFRRVLGDPGLQDVQCGYTAMTTATARLLVEHGFHASYGVYNDILSRVLSIQDSCVEYVPVAAIYGDEESHLRLRDVVRLGALTLRITWGRRQRAFVRMLPELTRARATRPQHPAPEQESQQPV